MKNKIETISKDKDKICGICKLHIDDKKEYAELTHYIKKDKIKGKDFYHIKCYQERVIGNVNILKTMAVAQQTLLDAREKLGLGERC